MRPPGSTSAPTPDLGANQEGQQSEFLSVAVLARQARHIVDAYRIPLSGSQLRRLLRNFVREGHTVIDLREYLLGYADPTGEQAVRNVMSSRS